MKPSTAAWVCNLMVRRQHAEITQLVELGGLLREPQVNLSGDQLKELGRQRSQVVAALTRQARALAAREGHPVSSAIAEQVEGTLRAAVADPDAGRALLDGRLTGALSYTGLGPVDLSGAVAPAVGTARGRAPARGRAGTPRRTAGDRAAREQQREEARQRRPGARHRGTLTPDAPTPSLPDGDARLLHHLAPALRLAPHQRRQLRRRGRGRVRAGLRHPLLDGLHRHGFAHRGA